MWTWQDTDKRTDEQKTDEQTNRQIELKFELKKLTVQAAKAEKDPTKMNIPWKDRCYPWNWDPTGQLWVVAAL